MIYTHNNSKYFHRITHTSSRLINPICATRTREKSPKISSLLIPS